MSAVPSSSVRTLAFGDLDAGVWGVAWGDVQQLAAVGAAQPGAALPGEPASIAGSDAVEEWTVASSQMELRLSPETEPVRSSELAGFDQLCRVHGYAVIDGQRHELDVPGRRGSRTELDVDELGSIRDVSAWFGPLDGLAVTALRPRGAKGHDRDLVVASVFEPGHALSVGDPRLSTTYAADGRPMRVGLELWPDQDDSDRQYPRRAAGEALGAIASGLLLRLVVEAYLLRYQSSRGGGIGVYLLARPR